uniref:SURP motif domain-containing protein n=1 Tax=Romanomermis culicivorax TaxID=13658 RepID=A0A915I4C7_ROMCU
MTLQLRISRLYVLQEKFLLKSEVLEQIDSGAPPVPPPPDVQPVVDRLALYVARNGPEFENMVRSGGDERFKFVNSGHPYYPYYQSRLQYYQYEIYMAYVGQTFMAALNEKTATSSSPQDVISTCAVLTANVASSNSPSTSIAEIVDESRVVTDMKPFHKPIGTSISFTFNKPKDKQSQENDLEESTSEIATDDLLLEKLNQDAPDDKANELLKEERRRKARLFLNMLKKNKTATNGGSATNSPEETNHEKIETEAAPSKVKKRRFDVMHKV